MYVDLEETPPSWDADDELPGGAVCIQQGGSSHHSISSLSADNLACASCDSHCSYSRTVEALVEMKANTNSCKESARLKELDIHQEHKRHFSTLATFGLSSSICSVLVGIIPLYGASLRAGGPGVMIWEWLLMGAFSLTHALCLAEMSSCYPTMGTLYYWSFRVAGPVWGPLLSWMTGWLNMLAQVASIGAAVYAASLEVATIASLLGPADVAHNQAVIFGTFTVLLLLAGVSNMYAVSVLARVSLLGILTHLCGCVFIVVFLLAFAPRLQSAAFVFTAYENHTGIDVSASVYLIGMLSAATTYTGYDAGASVAEESVNSHDNAPRAIVSAVVAAILLGSVLILGLNASIQDVAALVETDDAANVFNILVLQTVGAAGAVAFHCVLFLAMQCAACANVTSASRLVYSFSREGALPLSAYWSSMDAQHHSPVRAIWLAVLLTWLLGVVGWQGNMFPVFFALSTVAYYASYLLPVLSRVTFGWHKNFDKGAWSLGPLSRPLCAVSACFCAFVMVVLCLPLSTTSTNYAGPDLMAAVSLALVAWAVSARHWYLHEKVRCLPTMDSVVTFTSADGSEEPSSSIISAGWLHSLSAVGSLPASLAELQDAPGRAPSPNPDPNPSPSFARLALEVARQSLQTPQSVAELQDCA